MTIEFRPLEAEEVEVRVGQCSEKGCSLLLYKTSRTDVMLLNETVGADGWQCDYKMVGNQLFCGIGINVDGEWVWKWDTGTPANMEPEKSIASDGLKRSGFRWGLGIELYTAPFIWVPSDKCSVKKNERSGKYQCYDKFNVTEMVVQDGTIVKLTVVNNSRKGLTVYGNAPQKPREAAGGHEPKNDVLRIAYQKMGAAIEGYCERHGMNVDDAKAGVKKRPEWAEQCKSLEYIQAVTREFEEA